MIHILEGSVDPDRFAHEVGVNKLVVTKESACSTGLTSCIGFVALGGEKNVIGHFSDIAIRESEGKNKFVDVVYRAALNNASRYVLLGGAPYWQNGVNTTLQDRYFAIAFLNTHRSPHSEFDTKWTPEGMAIDFSVHPSKPGEPGDVEVYLHSAVELQVA